MWLSLPWSYWLGFALILWLLFDLVRGRRISGSHIKETLNQPCIGLPC